MSPTSSTVGRGGNTGFATGGCEPLASGLAPLVLLFFAEAPSAAAPSAPIRTGVFRELVWSMGTKSTRTSKAAVFHLVDDS